MFAHYDCSLSTFLSYMWIFFTGRITWMLVVNISPLYDNYNTKSFDILTHYDMVKKNS